MKRNLSYHFETLFPGKLEVMEINTTKFEGIGIFVVENENPAMTVISAEEAKAMIQALTEICSHAPIKDLTTNKPR